MRAEMRAEEKVRKWAGEKSDSHPHWLTDLLGLLLLAAFFYLLWICL